MAYKCEYCGKEFQKPVTSGHKRKCPEFLKVNPDRRPPKCLCGHESTSLTQMKRHRKSCDIWKSRDAHGLSLQRYVSTLQKKYGNNVTNSIHIPGVRDKCAATNFERYGAANPFCRESSLYEKIQSFWDGRDRTAHLPKDNFSRPEIKEKIRQYWIKNYGVENPTQVPEIRAKQLATNLERYGDEQTLRVSEIREFARQTMREKYGAEDAAQVPEILEKIRSTNMNKYGVPWTTMDPCTREQMHSSQIEHWGSMFFSSEIWLSMEPACREKRLQSFRDTCFERYGVLHPMQNREYAFEHLKHGRKAPPNSLEQEFARLCPEFKFTGDGSYYRFLPLINRHKNPDFVIFESGHFGNKVVEIFGTYWHCEIMTGKSSVEHTNEIITAWAGVGIDCMVIWEAEFSDVESIRNRILAWLGQKPSIVDKCVDQVDFNFDDVITSNIPLDNSITNFLKEYHYAGFGRSSDILYVAQLGDQIIAVAKFATPVRQGIAPSLGLKHGEVLELDRFCIHPAYHKKNFATHFMSKAMKWVAKRFEDVKKLVSFADPRFGHAGTIYRAANWQYIGKTSHSYYYIDMVGREINKKTVYDAAKNAGLIERRYAESLGYKKIFTPPKHKFVYDLKR